MTISPDPEPELGPQQQAFVDAVTTRIWSGVPLNEHDLAALAMVGRIVGFAAFVDLE